MRPFDPALFDGLSSINSGQAEQAGQALRLRSGQAVIRKSQ